MATSPAQRRVLPVFLKDWLPVLLYVGVILTLSAQPYLRPPFEFANADKSYHVLEYFGLGVLLGRAMRDSRPGRSLLVTALLALLLGVLVGAGDETFQRFVPGRDSSLLDLLADTTGVLMAQLAVLLAVRE